MMAARRSAAFLTGVLYALAQPFVWPGDAAITNTNLPVHLLGLVCLVPLLLAIRDLGPWRAFLLSGWAIIPSALLQLSWIGVAMYGFGGLPAPVAAGFLAAICLNAWVLMGTAVAGAKVLEQRLGWKPEWALAVAWVGMEHCRAYFPVGGFPWGAMASSQTGNLWLLQLASLGGTHAVGAVVLLCNGGLARLAAARVDGLRFPRTSWGVALILVCSHAYGAWRVAQLDAQIAAAPTIQVAMLQGNIPQAIKSEDWKHQDLIMSAYEPLQARALTLSPDLIVWPEMAYPYLLEPHEQTLASRRFPPLGNASALVGAQVALPGDDATLARRMFNSALLVAPDGTIVDRSAKGHLVPFGEYVPWPLTDLAQNLVPSMASTVAGEVRAMTVPTRAGPASVGVLICFEGIFARYARKLHDNGAQVILSLVNEGWYGVSSAPLQHLAFLPMRAVETGRAIGRVSNNGVSAAIDPAGRILSRTPLFEPAVLDMHLPLLNGTTLYMITGDVLGNGCAAVLLTALVYALVLANRRRLLARTSS